MHQLTYNASIAAGTLLASVGAGLQWGLPTGLMVGGVLVLALTLATAWLAPRSA